MPMAVEFAAKGCTCVFIIVANNGVGLARVVKVGIEAEVGVKIIISSIHRIGQCGHVVGCCDDVGVPLRTATTTILCPCRRG